MNCPAAGREVSERIDRIPLEKSELLRVELGVLLLPALLDDVALDLPFAPVAADRTDGAPIRPELPAPETLLDRGHPAEDLAGRVRLLMTRTSFVGLYGGIVCTRTCPWSRSVPISRKTMSYRSAISRDCEHDTVAVV
jgi:hypothetical protein